MSTEQPTGDYLSVHARTIGDRVAVIDDRPGEPIRRLTYAELELEANRLANALRRRGIEPGHKVMWCGQNSLPLAAFIHACRKAGCVAVPLNYRLSDSETAYVVDNSDSVLAYVDAAYAPLFERIADQTPSLSQVVVFDGTPGTDQISHEQFVAGAGTDPVAGADPDSAGATMIYTSGTTGKPKGAVRRRVANADQSAALLELIGYRPDDVYLTTGPLYHSGPGGFAGIAWALGNTVVLQHRFDAEDWLRLVQTYRVSTTFAAPTPIRRVCTLDRALFDGYDVSSMRIMIANAAPWSYALKELYLERFPPESLWEVYGSTEMGVNCVLAPEDQLRKPGSCGRAAPLVEVALFDDQGQRITEPGVPGELYVKASSVFDTYYKAQDKYDDDQRGEYHTVGDVAYVDDEGYYYICDRKKDMIISGGMNIYPAEVEAALEASPDVYDVAVFGIPSEEWGEAVHAVVVPTPGHDVDAATVTAWARERLAGYKVPRSISFLDELPRTGSGKILKRDLRKPFWEETP